MFVSTYIEQLIDCNGNPVDRFPIREFLALFPIIEARDSYGESHVLRGNNCEDGPTLEICYCSADGSTFAHVQLLLLKVGVEIELEPAAKALSIHEEWCSRGHEGLEAFHAEQMKIKRKSRKRSKSKV